jgi:hypothetical protein
MDELALIWWQLTCGTMSSNNSLFISTECSDDVDIVKSKADPGVSHIQQKGIN